MPIFIWECKSCDNKTTKLLNKKPKLEKCNLCGGYLDFVYNITSRIIEVRDNGCMPKKVEQLADIKRLIEDNKNER